MMTITVCVGSSCYVRGSESLAETFETLIRRQGLEAKVELTGAFCMEQCSMGVSVRVGERVFHCINPLDAEKFFQAEVMPYVAVASAA